jgi:hypothetical protein
MHRDSSWNVLYAFTIHCLDTRAELNFSLTSLFCFCIFGMLNSFLSNTQVCFCWRKINLSYTQNNSALQLYFCKVGRYLGNEEILCYGTRPTKLILSSMHRFLWLSFFFFIGFLSWNCVWLYFFPDHSAHLNLLLLTTETVFSEAVQILYRVILKQWTESHINIPTSSLISLFPG